MTDARPEPLVKAGVDLRDFPFTPMFRARLFGSEFHAKANDSEWRAGVTLWLKSWDQVPAGTLPIDDISLCRLAELGRDGRAWRKLKARSMHGWIECSDGRYHHKVVAEGVTEAWDRKLAQRDRTAKARAARLSQQLLQTENEQHTSSVTDEKKRDFSSKGQGEGEGQGEAQTPSPPPHENQDSKIISLSGNGLGNGEKSRTNGAVTIEDSADRIARFQAKLAEHFGRNGWVIVAAATVSSDPDHKRSLALCKQAARELNKGWPHAWPISP